MSDFQSQATTQVQSPLTTHNNIMISNYDMIKAPLFEFFLTCGLKELDQDTLIKRNANTFYETQLLQTYPNTVLPRALRSIDKWCFPEGLKIVKQGEPKYNKIEEYINAEDEKLATTVSELNYFVITDLSSMTKYYCTSTLVYDKVYLMEQTQQISDRPAEIYLPKSLCVASRVAWFLAQKNFLSHLLLVNKMRQNIKKDRIIECYRDNRVYVIEESKLTDFYVQSAFQCAQIRETDYCSEICFEAGDAEKNSWFRFYGRNNELHNTLAILSPSNNAFEAVVFNQSPYNMIKLLSYALLEYQIIFLTRRPPCVAIFTEALFELMRPFHWRGVYMPFLLEGHFDFENTTIPYIIGLERGRYKFPQQFREGVKRRVIYDLDENRFVTSTGDPKIPKKHQNYCLQNLNHVIADLKFWEEDYFEEGVLRYKQHIYNLILSIFHDIMHFFSRSEQIPVSGGATTTTSPSSQSINAKKQKRVAYFNFQAYLSNVDAEYKPFFEVLIKTQIFNHFIKECFKAIDFKNDFVVQSRKNQLDYSYLGIFQFVADVRLLASRKDGSFEQHLKSLEEFQSRIIADILDHRRYFRERKHYINDLLPEYLELLKSSQSTAFKSTGRISQMQFDDAIPGQQNKGTTVLKENDVEQQQQEQDSATVYTTGDHHEQQKNRRGMKHLKLFHKKYTMLRRNQRDEQSDLDRRDVGSQNSNSMAPNQYLQQQQQQLQNGNSSEMLSNKTKSSTFEIQSAYSTNYGKYLPKRRSSHSIPREINISVGSKVHNKSFHSLWPAVGEDASILERESNNERD